MVEFTGPAAAVKSGDTVTYCGETFVVQSVTETPTGLLRFAVAGAAPQYVWAEREVEIQRASPQEQKPYVVYTRRYFKSGKCQKRVHRYATRAEQERFLRTTTAAVTYSN